MKLYSTVWRKLAPNGQLNLTPEKCRLLSNTCALLFLNGINYLVPLLLIPYLMRVLGGEKFGIYGYACAVLTYFAIPVRYGFDFSATKQTSLIRDDGAALSRYFSTVIAARLLLFLVASSVLLLLCAAVERLHSEWPMYSSGILLLLGTALCPSWFFQGMESMKFMTIVTGLGKLASFVLIILCARTSSSYRLVFFLYCLGFAVAGVAGIVIARRRFGIGWQRVTMAEIVEELRRGWDIFVSGLGTSLYAEINILIIGFTASYTVIGYYFLATRVIRGAQQLTLPLLQALFPFMSRRLNDVNGNAQGLALYHRIGKAYAALLFCLAIAISVLAPLLVRVAAGTSQPSAIADIQILSTVIFLGGLNHYLGVTGMVNLGHERTFAWFTWAAGLVGVASSLLLSPIWSDKGASTALVLAECALFTLSFSFMKRRHLAF